jgi:hypothetical protein
MWIKRDRVQNQIARRPHYVGLSLMEAESRSLFDT